MQYARLNIHFLFYLALTFDVHVRNQILGTWYQIWIVVYDYFIGCQFIIIKTKIIEYLR